MVMISINEYLDLWLDNEITSYITYAIGLFGTLQLIVESPMESAEKIIGFYIYFKTNIFMQLKI